MTLIFGATGDVGRAVARQLAGAGRKIHLAARDECELGELARELGCDWSVMDALEPTSIDRVIAQNAAQLAAVVWAIGAMTIVADGALPDADVMRVHAVAPARLLRSALRSMPDGGRIVLCCRSDGPGYSGGAVSCRALADVMAALAEQARPSIAISAVGCGGESPDYAVPLPGAENENGAAGMASAVLYLLSPAADGVAGRIVWVDDAASIGSGERAPVRAEAANA